VARYADSFENVPNAQPSRSDLILPREQAIRNKAML
jgi:hypothetical protein